VKKNLPESRLRLRTITDADAAAIAERVAALIASPGVRAIDTNAIYTAEQASDLASLHPDTLRKKLRCGIITGERKAGSWRIRGAELLKLG